MDPENKLLVKLSVRISGNAKDYAVSSMFLNQSIGAHHHFNIELRGEELDETVTHELKTQLGKPLDIKFFQGNTVKVKFKGIVTGINLSNDSDDHKTMTLSGNSDTIRMDDGKNSRCFKEVTYPNLIDKIFQDYKSGIGHSIQTKENNTKLPIFIQYKESNFNALLRICELSGNWIYYDGEKLRIGEPPEDESKDIIIGQTGGHYQIEASLIPANLEYRTYNYLSSEVYKVKTKAKAKDGKNELVSIVVEASNELFTSNTVSPSIEFHKTGQDFNVYGETMQNTYISGSVRITGSSTDPSLSIGDLITLFEKKGDNQKSIGQFFVVQIQHSSNVSGYYQNQFEAIPKEVQLPPLNPNIVYPKAEDQTAIVIDNQDPDKLGRVKVQFIWQDDKNDANWIRVLSPMGGKEHGLLYIPEIEDHVLIGFEFDNPNRPYVKGAFYNSKQNTEHLFNRFGNLVKNQAEGRVKGGVEQALKGIFTKEGHHIVINEQGISLYTKEGKALVVISTTNDGLVYVNSQGKVIISSKEISIDATEKLKLNAQTIEIDASDKLILKGGNKTELKGGTEVEIKGGMIKLN